MHGRLEKYGESSWRGHVYLGRADGRQVRRSKVIHEPRTRAGKKRAEKALREFMASLESDSIINAEQSQAR